MKTLPKSKIIKIGTVHPHSTTIGHGIEVDDEILLPRFTSGLAKEPAVIHDLFIAATQKRLIAATKKTPIFDVRDTTDIHRRHA